MADFRTTISYIGSTMVDFGIKEYTTKALIAGENYKNE